ncbi:MAG: glycosyltransferase [Planctomycetia bacterium]|nr:glycosyltransferase [Planctomycetia bacterium]
MPMFSVVMSVFNQEKLVSEAIDSVLRQTFADWELLLIDDGSSDGTPAILDAAAAGDPRIRLLRHSNRGLAASRQRAATEARAPWLTYLDSDDIWLPDALQHFAEYLDEHAEAKFLYGYYHRLVGERVEHLSGRLQDRITGTADLFAGVFLNPMCVCHRRELCEQAGGYDVRLRNCDDYDLYLRMSLQCRFEPVNQPIGLRRRHANNMSAPSGRSQQCEAEVLRRFVDERGGRALLTPDAIARRLGTVYARAARQYYRESNYTAARTMADEARRYKTSVRNELIRLVCRRAPQKLAA